MEKCLLYGSKSTVVNSSSLVFMNINVVMHLKAYGRFVVGCHQIYRRLGVFITETAEAQILLSFCKDLNFESRSLLKSKESWEK